MFIFFKVCNSIVFGIRFQFIKGTFIYIATFTVWIFGALGKSKLTAEPWM